jgi:hypothetical protein
MTVLANDVFEFYVDPTDNLFGGAQLTISGTEVHNPEPGTFVLFGTALLGLYFLRRGR